jgi:hypothetical protein
MAGIFKSLKRVLTGEILHQIDTPIIQGRAILSLRLKRQTGSDKKYVVLAGTSSGNYQYFPFDLDEFERFVEAAIDIRAAAQSTSGGVSKKPEGSA